MANCSGGFNTVCKGMACNASVPCTGLFCDYPADNITGCQVSWQDSSTPSAFLCIKPKTQGICVPCPPGWSAAGAYCQPCSTGMSCDVMGRATCSGECSPGAFPICDATTGASTCAACNLNAVGIAAAHQTVTRGGVLSRADLCGAYFQCSVGYYLYASANYTLQCFACQLPETFVSKFEFVSGGLTYGDPYSCAYRPAVLRAYANVPGFYGAPAASCPSGSTSERGRAATVADCVPCQNAPVNGRIDPMSFVCGIQCNQGYTRVGEACVSPTRFQCPVAGYALSGGQCISVSLPWSAVGWSGVEGSVSFTVSTWSLPGVVYYDAESGVAVTPTQFFTRVKPSDGTYPSDAPYCPAYVASKGYVQDTPLYALTCDSLDYHRFYMVIAAPPLLSGGNLYAGYFAFLERDMGFNNRNLLWWVTNSYYQGHIEHRWRLPGRVCSASSVSMGASNYLYLSFCNASFVSFLNLSASLPGTTFRDGVRTDNSECGRRADLLIGTDSIGNVDGARDEARFGDTLSLASFQTNRVFILDRINCRLAEAVVDYPGSALTRVSTLRSNCHDRTLGLAYPRMLTPVLGSTLFLFATDRGLMQIDTGLRTIQSIAGAAVPDNLMWLGADASGTTVYAGNGTHTISITAAQQRCQLGTTSLAGLSCAPCNPGQYVSSTGVCTQCSSGVTCGPGFILSNCTGAFDWSCTPCGVLLASAFRYVEDCTTVYVSPCPIGYYGSGDCTRCPEWATTARTNATSISECMCQYNGTMMNGGCVIQAPAWDETSVIPDWILPYACSNDECGFKGCYLQSVVPRVCAPCSAYAGTIGMDGVRCSNCTGFRVPNPSLDACMCRTPSRLSDDGMSCVCPLGNGIAAGQGCAACALSTFNPSSISVAEGVDWALQSSPCAVCPPGWTTDGTGATACVPCPEGLYREEGMTACASCAEDWYAADSSSEASCVQCSSECGYGLRWTVCPGSSRHFVCTECSPVLRPNEVWVVGADNTDCKRQCLPGFFRSSGATDCMECTINTDCPPGFTATRCSAYADFACDVPCSDATMPADNAVWASGCTWRCADGYVKRTKKVLSWTEYACEKVDSMAWPGWS